MAEGGEHPHSSMIRGTRKKSPARSGALASMASAATDGRRLVLAHHVAQGHRVRGRLDAGRCRARAACRCRRGSRPARARMRSSSASVSVEAGEPRHVLDVFARSSMAPSTQISSRCAYCSDRRLRPTLAKPHGGDHVLAFALDAHHEALAPARVAQPRADPERQVLVHVGGGRAPTGAAGIRGVLGAAVQQGELAPPGSRGGSARARPRRSPGCAGAARRRGGGAARARVSPT